MTANGSMQAEMNVTPMIDVLLVLLIIFMVIVPTLSRGEPVIAPQPATQAARADAVVLEILAGVSGEAGFRINRQPVSRQDLPARLAAIYANRADRVLFVKGDDRLRFTQIAEAIDISHAAGVDRVSLITPGAHAGL